jgi:hypothetical protein
MNADCRFGICHSSGCHCQHKRACNCENDELTHGGFSILVLASGPLTAKNADVGAGPFPAFPAET